MLSTSTSLCAPESLIIISRVIELDFGPCDTFDTPRGVDTHVRIRDQSQGQVLHVFSVHFIALPPGFASLAVSSVVCRRIYFLCACNVTFSVAFLRGLPPSRLDPPSLPPHLGRHCVSTAAYKMARLTAPSTKLRPCSRSLHYSVST